MEKMNAGSMCAEFCEKFPNEEFVKVKWK